MSFIIKQIKEGCEQKSILETGFDPSYADKCVDKYEFKLFKIFGLTPQQATILKQSALSVGADAALHREVITCKTDNTDVVVGGSLRQINDISSKLAKQPFGLAELAKDIRDTFNESSIESLKIRNKVFEWGRKTYLMGILNITPDSFSDGGKYFDKEAALTQAQELSLHSDIIDIGGESTRPYSEEIPPEEEISRICPVIESIRNKDTDTIISVDTRNAKTAQEAIWAGADIINDVSGASWDSKMFDVMCEFDVPIILMHSIRTPQNMQDNPSYNNLIDEIYLDLNRKIDRALSLGVKKNNIIIDVGIGFGKTLEHNIELLSRMAEFKSLGCPLLIGVSRKSFIPKMVEMDLEEKDISTLCINSLLVSKGIDIVRVHNPKLHKKPLAVIDRLDRG